MKDKNKEQHKNETQNDIEALRASEDRFRSLVETTSDWIWEVDKNGVYTYVSPKIRDILGYEPEEILGKTPFDLMPAVEAKRISDIFSAIVVSQKPFKELENINLHKDGHEVTLETSGNPFFDKAGQLVGYRGIDRDITRRKDLEHKLKMSEEKYRLLFTTENDAIIIVDAESRRIVDANGSALQLYGYGKEEILKLKGHDLSSEPEKSKAAIDEITRSSDRQYHFHTRNHRKKDGTIFPVEISSGTFMLQDHKMISAVIRDVSEHKRMLKELEESNTALKVLLKQRENDKKVLEENILSNIKNLIMPYILKMKKSKPKSEELSDLNIVELNLKEIVSPFSVQLTSKYLALTPKEIQIANLIKEGYQDKDIAEMLNLSLDTIKSHRQNIRKKLGIYGNRTNLRTHLLSSSFILK
jgi:PAS domain S-box-containing protein